MRIQLARPGQTMMTPEIYDQIFIMHGVTMIFWFAAPILFGFANYFIPLLIGARDMAFPRLNAFTYFELPAFEALPVRQRIHRTVSARG